MLNQLLVRVASAVGLTVFLMVLSACATTRVVEHGIAPQVKGTQTVYDIHVVYGARELRFDGKRPPGSGGGWTGYMPIPSQMTVSWTAEGTRTTRVIQLEGRLSPDRSLENWNLIFVDGHLEVWREDLVEPPATPTGLRKRHSVKVYP